MSCRRAQESWTHEKSFSQKVMRKYEEMSDGRNSDLLKNKQQVIRNRV